MKSKYIFYNTSTLPYIKLPLCVLLEESLYFLLSSESYKSKTNQKFIPPSLRYIFGKDIPCRILVLTRGVVRLLFHPFAGFRFLPPHKIKISPSGKNRVGLGSSVLENSRGNPADLFFKTHY